MSYEFPEPNKLQDLCQRVYRELKRVIINDEIRTDKKTEFLRSKYRISMTSIIDYYERKAWLNIAFWKSKITDSIDPIIEKKVFSDLEPKKEDENEMEFEAREYHWLQFHDHFYEFCHGEYDRLGVESPWLSVLVPHFLLLGDDAKHIAQYVYTQYFEFEKFNGEEFQRRTATIRFLTTSSEQKTKLAEEVSSLRSKNQNDPHHELYKGTLIGKFFDLLGFETLIIDQMKTLPPYEKIYNKRNIDVLAFSFATQGLILVEETSKLTKKYFHKLEIIPNMFETFTFLKKPSLWRITHLFIAPSSEIIRSEITDLYKNKNVVFWNLHTFKEYFCSILAHDLKVKRDPPKFSWGVDKTPSLSKDSYEDIYSRLIMILLGKAKRPVYDYR